MSTSSLSDADLLDRFSRERDDDAFGELVRRHVGWVHSTAVRLVFGDAFAAEEVTQDVFTDLARKSASLARDVRGGRPLAGWLHNGTRLAASNYRRTASRRLAREMRAGERNEIELMNHVTSNSAGWDEIRPLIDEALAELPLPDRDAVLMRFFQEMDLRSIGSALGVSEDAARKRVDRALDRLRDWMGSRGVRTTAAALISAVMAHGIVPPPAGMSARIASKAVLGHGEVTVGLHSRWSLIAAVGIVLVVLTAWSNYQRMHSRRVPMMEVGQVQNVGTEVLKLESAPPEKPPVPEVVSVSRNPRIVRIPKRFLDRFSFLSVVMTNSNDRRFAPSKRFVTLFRLTPAEVEGAVAALDKALHAYRTIEGQRLTPAPPPEPNTLVPEPPPTPPGTPLSRMVVLEQRHFTLKPFPEEALAIHQALEAAILSIFGTQRGSAFVRLGGSLKGEMRTFEELQTIESKPAQMVVFPLFTYRLVQTDQGPIVDLQRTSSPGYVDVSPYGEDLDQYVPEGLSADLARWRVHIREKGSTYFEWAAGQKDLNYDPPIGALEDSIDLGPWDDESLTMEIHQECLDTLGIVGLTPGETITEDAIGLLGLTEAEVAVATKIQTQTKEKFLELERQHFVRASSNSFDFVLHAFPRENAALRLEFAQSLRNLLGDDRGEMLFTLIRAPMSLRAITEWMRKPMEVGLQNEAIEQVTGKRWMDRGDHEIHLKLVRESAGWSVEHRSFTDPKDVGADETLNWNRVPLRWRHLLTPDLVETAVVRAPE